jgi:glycosyltransferase involved in cell wall biosynthesis
VASSLISVVIPCRNAERWLGETLASVFVQDVALDVIVVDDGSTDGSVAVAERAPGPVRIIRQDARGASEARNAGTAAAVGRYLQYLDADDVLEPGTLQARLAALDAAGADVALAAWARWERQPSGEFRIGDVVHRRLSERPDVDLIAGAWWPPGAILYRRSIVDRIGGWRVDLPIIQDARFLIDAALCGAEFIYVDDLGLRYRVHGSDSLSRRDPRAFLDDCYRSAAELHDRWRRDGTLDEPRRRGLVRALGHVARGFFDVDRARFDEVLARLDALDARYRPDGPPSLRWLSGVVGYRSAEHVAWWWRQVKRTAVGADTPR